MHAPLEIDWHAIKADRAKGFPFSELAARYGGSTNTIKQRAHREQWPVPGMSQAQELFQAVKPKGPTLAKIRENVAASAQQSITRAMERLVTIASDQATRIMGRASEMAEIAVEAKELADAARAWEIGHNGARKALGMDRPDQVSGGGQWSVLPGNAIDCEAIEEDVPRGTMPELTNELTNEGAKPAESLGNQPSVT